MVVAGAQCTIGGCVTQPVQVLFAQDLRGVRSLSLLGGKIV